MITWMSCYHLYEQKKKKECKNIDNDEEDYSCFIVSLGYRFNIK